MEKESYSRENYTVWLAESYAEKNVGFALHSHEGIYEVLFIESGTPDFWVEGTAYKLKPGDLVIARQDEMHQIIHSKSYLYRRFVVNVEKDFFVIQGCEKYCNVFEKRAVGVGNYFSAEEVKETGIEKIIKRIKKYTALDEEVLVKGALCELFWAINSLPEKERRKEEGLIKEVVLYINDNITKSLTIDYLASCFYVSKYHLCRIFKEKMGLTISKYISHKRILLVKEMCSQGKNITEACISAGFGDYSSFYVAYRKETGNSPRHDLK